MRSGEGTSALLLFLVFFLFVTFQYTTKSVRQSTFISSLGAAKLPWVYLFVAICSYPFLRVYGRFADRMPRHHLIAATCLIIAASMVGFWWLFQFPLNWVPAVFYVWVSIVYVMTVSQFWSFANHVFDPRQAKRLFGFVGAGGLLGGIAGGQVARIATGLVGTRYTLLVAAVIVAAVVALIYLTQHLHPPDDARVAGAAGLDKLEKARGGFDAIRRSRHLQLISAVMLLMTVVAQIVDIQFNWAVEQATAGQDQRTAFFGNFFSIMGVAAFLFQLVFTARIHRILGVGIAMRIMPVTMAIGTGALFLSAGWFQLLLKQTAMLLKVAENGIRYSLEQATRELLFLPVPSAARLKAKAFIDVFIQRGAKGLAALLLLPVTFKLMTPVEAGWISLGLIAVWLTVTVWMHREYIRSFRRGLRRRAVDTAVPVNLADVTTLELLVQSLGSTDPRQVLHSLEILSSNGRGKLVPPLLLYHDDPEVRRRTLQVLLEAGRTDAASLIERRLGDRDPEVRVEASRVLASLSGRDLSDLMLPRLRGGDPGVRAAAVACLASHPQPEIAGQARETLQRLISDGDPSVRSEAAKAIGATSEPLFREQLIRLLYDGEPGVVRQAISAVRRRVARDGYSPLYVPTLISLLRDRRVKHEAREALIAFGEEALPTLAHFMNAADEPLWVRRALPKTIAEVGTANAAATLLKGLGGSRDHFLRRKLIESLASLEPGSHADLDGTLLAQEVRRETAGYLQALADLSTLGFAAKGRMIGPVIHWEGFELVPELLERLLGEKMEEHLRNLFGLLTCRYPAADLWASYRGLTGPTEAPRAHALEYLDNTLGGELKSCAFAALGDLPLEEKLKHAEHSLGAARQSKEETLRRLLADDELDDTAGLTMAVLYAVYSERAEGLYPEIMRLMKEGAHPQTRETAQWVGRRLGLEAA